jgi:hypothetical protein
VDLPEAPFYQVEIPVDSIEIEKDGTKEAALKAVVHSDSIQKKTMAFQEITAQDFIVEEHGYKNKF